MDNLNETNLDKNNEDKLNIPFKASIPTTQLPYDLTNEGMGSVFGGWPQKKLEETQDKTGFFKTLGLEAKEQSVIFNAIKSGYGFAQSEYNYLFDNVDKEFNTNNPDLYQDIPEIYWPTIRNATSPNDLKRRQNIVSEEIENQKLLANGGFWPKLIGGGLGMTIGSGPIGLSKWVLPAISEIRSGTFTVDALMNVAKQTPGIALDAFTYESALDLSKGRYDFEDVAIRSLEDSLFGFGLATLGKTLRYGSDGIKIWNGRKILGAMYHDAKLEPVFTDGKLTEFKYTAPVKEAMSAQRHSEIENDLRNIVSKSGFYGIPYVGKGLEKTTKIFNPAFRALSSPFEDFRNFFVGIADYGIRTSDELEGFAKKPTAEQFLNLYRATGSKYRIDYDNHYYKANGLESSYQTVNAFKNLKQVVTKQQNISRDEFGTRVRSVATTGIADENPHVNNAANQMIEILQNVNKEYASAHGMDEFLDPRNAVNYVFQNWNTDKLYYDPADYYTIYDKHLQEQYNLIQDLTEPLRNIDEKISSLKSKSQQKIWLERRKEVEKELHNKLTDNQQYHQLLKDRVFLNSKERAELQTIYDKYGLSETKNEIEKLKLEKETIKNKTQLEVINLRLKELKGQLDAAKNLMRIDAEVGRINKRFFYKDKGKIKFRDPNKLPEFLEIPKTKEARLNVARKARAKILGTTASDLQDEVLGHGSHSEMPAYTRERSILIPQELLNQAGYLDNDLAAGMSNYLNSMGRRIGLKRGLGEIYGEGGLDDIFSNLQKQYDETEKAYQKIKDDKQRIKKLKKLDDDFKTAKSDMKAMYDIYHGRYGKMNDLESITQPMQILRNMVYASRLGLLPIAQLSDSTAVILRTGIVPWLFNGLIPHLKSWATKFQGNKTEMQEAAAVNMLGVNHALSGVQYDWFNKGTHNYDTKIGKLLKASEFLAQKSQNLTFANYFENINESIAERTFQNNIVKGCQNYINGTISKSETIQMARLGIDLAEDAKSIVEQFNKYGETKFNGLARNSNYQNWDNADIQEKMILAVRSGVSDTVVKGQLFTSPYAMKNPILGTLFMFTSWAFAATERYLLPSLQYADANTLQGIIAMSVMSVIQDPLRRMVSGKPPIEDEAEFKDIMLNSIMQNGFLGILPSAIESINLITHNDLLGKAQGFRYKDRATLGGPAWDYAWDVLGAGYMLASGKINQTGVKKAINLLPGSGNFYIRGLINAWREGLDIPESFSEAEPYGIFQKE